MDSNRNNSENVSEVVENTKEIIEKKTTDPEDTVDIADEEWSSVFEDPVEYKKMFMNILKQDNSYEAQIVLEMLTTNNITPELDIGLRSLSRIVPYNILVPFLREQLGLTIQTDKECITHLETIKEFLTEPSDRETINRIITAIREETDLDEDIFPELDLLSIVEQIPIEKHPAIFNCVEYINQIYDFKDGDLK